MNQGIDISIEKLSAPVEMLNINRRACHLLRRASLYTVAEVLLAGKSKPRSAKHIGALTWWHIFGAVASYLGLPEEQVTGEAALQAEPLMDPCNSPISVLPLPYPTLLSLGSMGVFQIKELINSRANRYSNFLGFEAQEILDIDGALNSYLAKAAQSQLLPFVGTDAILEPRSGADLSLILQGRGLNERSWSVLELNAMQLLTLKEISIRLGELSRERVGQLIWETHEHLHRKRGLLSHFFDHFEEKSKVLQKSLARDPLDLKTLVLHLLPDPTHSELVVGEKEVERMIVLVRSLILHPRPWFREEMETKWPAFILLSCLVQPVLAQHEQVRQILEERKPKQKKQTTREIIYSVLARTRKPMHWSDIAEEVSRLSGGRTISGSAVHNLLTYHKKLFARVGRGTYALVEWGSQTVEMYPAIIASLLRQENRPVPFDLIFERVSAIRPVKRSSLTITLDFHPRFYQSIQKTYGLRGWLAQEETQDVPTPDWLREDSTSLKRVERARAKGCHVEKIIAEDRLCPQG
jgi:hypothetical protein